MIPREHQRNFRSDVCSSLAHETEERDLVKIRDFGNSLPQSNKSSIITTTRDSSPTNFSNKINGKISKSNYGLSRTETNSSIQTFYESTRKYQSEEVESQSNESELLFHEGFNQNCSEVNPPYSSIEELVRLNGGTHVITRILVANNGNAAIKAIRSLRHWAYSMIGNDKALEFVVMATTDDIEANQEYISEGDFLVEVPSGPTNNNYTNLYLIVQIAEEYECDAVWPGWGHASENFKFPLVLGSSPRQPIWIGPQATSMIALGDKIGSTIIAQSVGVPCVPWSGSHIKCSELDLANGLLSPAFLDSACVKSAEDALDVCERLEFPVMIKASAGGGGKGIRKIHNRNEVIGAYRQVVNEVKDSTVLIMKFVERCRHLEIQVISDLYGNTMALGSRDCSIQRRCQKIIEEGPVVTAPKHIIEQMEDWAVRLCKAVNYCNAATCEFMYDLDTNQIYFLEVNARLQVEHVVTEVVSDLNLPAAQLQIAMGISLENIPDIKRFAKNKAAHVEIQTHCIAARVTSEHAEDNFKPTCGDVFELQLRTSMNVWGYFCIGATGKVHTYADSQIGHIFASGRNREIARKNLITALKGLTIRGEIRTNVEALLTILQVPDFISNNTHTMWVENSVRFGASQNTNAPQISRTIDIKISPIEKSQHRLLQAVLLASAYKAFLRFKRSEDELLEKIGQGQLPPTIKVRTSFDLVFERTRFDIQCFQTGPFTIAVQLNNSTAEVLFRLITLSTQARSTNDDSAACFLVSGGFDGRSRRVFYKIDQSGVRVTFDGSTFTFIKESDPSQVRAPVSGKLSRWLVSSGAHVQRGQPYAEIEIMKMYMQLQVAESGILSHALAEGAVFKSGYLLATLEFPDGLVFEKAEAFQGTFPSSNDVCNTQGKSRVSGNDSEDGLWGIRHQSNGVPHPIILRNFRFAKDRLIGALNGYYCDPTEAQRALDILTESLFNKFLPQLEIAESLSVLEPYLPPVLSDQLYAALQFKSINSISSSSSFEGQQQALSECSNQLMSHSDQQRISTIAAQSATSDQDSTSGVCNDGKKHFSFVSFKGCPVENESLETSIDNEKCIQTIKQVKFPAHRLFDIIEDYLVKQAASGESSGITRIQLEPLTDLLRKYDKGLLEFAVGLFISLLNQYLDIEEVFHQHDSESTAKVLLNKRTELEASQLAVLARSHQALSQKNLLVIKIIGSIRQIPEFMERISLFSDVLQRLSSLSKPEYAAVSLRARQLLLTRRQKSFIERTFSMVESLYDYIERRQPLLNGMWTLHSPTTTSTNKPYHISTPMTPIPSSAPFGFSGGGMAGMHSGITNALAFGIATTNSMIQHFVSDLEDVGDDSLIALLGHPLGQLRKLALEIFVRRHYDRWGLHDLRIRCDNESWHNPLAGSISSSESDKTGIVLKPQQYRASTGLTPSRWNPNGAFIFNPSDTWGTTIPTFGWRGTPTWRSATVATTVTPMSQHGFGRPKFFDESIGTATGNPTERLCHFPTNRTSTDNLPIASHVGHPALPFEMNDVEGTLRTEEDRTRQRINKLLAVWIHKSVICREFLVDTCDMITATRCEGRLPLNPLIGPIQRTESTVDSLLTNSSNVPTNGLNPTLRLNDAKHQETELLGLERDSRLQHMLNAFAGVGGESGDQAVGRSQMTVAMAFGTFEQFKSNFAAGLEEYSTLQEAMPQAPPGPDGKFLMIFISDVSQIFDGARNSDELNSSSELRPKKSNRLPLSCNAQFEAEIQSHSVLLSSLGFHLIGVGFLHGRQAEDIHTEFNRIRPGIDQSVTTSTTTVDRLPSSAETTTGRQYQRRIPSLEGFDTDGVTSSVPRRSTFPFLGDFSSRPRLATQPVTDTSNFDPLLPISESGETNSIDHGCYESPPCMSIRSQHFSVQDHISNSTDSVSSHQRVPIPFQRVPLSIQSAHRKIPPEDAFSDIDLIGSSLPRYCYFRNISEIVPFSNPISDRSAGSPLLGVVDDHRVMDQNFVGLPCPNKQDPIYSEEPLLRNAICTEFGQLELKRLFNFSVKVEPTSIPNIHMYEATPKIQCPYNRGQSNRHDSRPSIPSRFFVRILLQYRITGDDQDAAEQERHFVAALNALEIASKSSNQSGVPSHHMMISIILQTTTDPTGPNTSRASGANQRLSPAAAELSSMALVKRYQQRLMKNRVDVVEVRFAQRSSQASDTFVPIRLVITNPTGQSLRIRKFVELTDSTTGELVYSALDASDRLAISVRQPIPFPQPSFHSIPSLHNGVDTTNDVPTSQMFNYCHPPMSQKGFSYDGRPVCTPHPLAGPLDEKRARAAEQHTIYIYDFLDLFEEAIKKQWRTCPKYFVPSFRGDQTTSTQDLGAESPITSGSTKNSDMSHPTTFLPARVLESVELKLDNEGKVEEIYREPGSNECGMVAWSIVMRTPEFPRGRRIILIGNDVTYQAGSFGVQEDCLFQKVSEVARKQGIPRVYIAVNAGARMGLAHEVQKVFKIEWVNPDHPSQGFKYLYVTEDDYIKLKETESIASEPIEHMQHGKIYRITSVIGENGLGVENLCGSGAIAGETSRAYQSNVTITFVTGRTVGIGAYITRLGQRVIQKANGAPILLTGFQALNRLIGRDVYCSNDAIGGVDIMSRNGVSHIVVENDMEGCEEIIRWLSYIPEHREGPLPFMMDPTDPYTRPVAYKIQSLTEDPRLMLTGCVDSRGRWLGGILDRGSFKEVMNDWAKSVIVGRARLGGIPVGIISVETRVTESVLPADPAMSNSTETKLVRAGQVWFPDSAYKTAQAINDFNKEEIPLMIFANWRGFSGGQRDMFYEVLKFGSFIVDALVNFKQPCLVYIPPKSELRGGAWVVVDRRINPDFMEMFADPESRGGVLEPTGLVGIKFKEKALIELSTRLDDILKSIAQEDKELAAEGVARDDPRRQVLKEKKDRRLHELLPIYKQVAEHFSDLHDTAIRMKRKNAISEIVPWERSRQFFYWRLRRQLILFSLRSEIVKADPSISLSGAERVIDEWAKESGRAFSNVRPSSLSAASSLNSQFVHWACHSWAEINRHLDQLKKNYWKRRVEAIYREAPDVIVDAVKNTSHIHETEFNRYLKDFPSHLAHNHAVSRTSSTSGSATEATFNGLTMLGSLDSCMH